MYQQPDQQLIIKAKAGDRQAFEKIVELTVGFLYAVAFRYLNNKAEAEDAVQETLVKLWKNFSNYKMEVKLSTWLYRILVNHCLDLKKSRTVKFQNQYLSIEGATNFSTGQTPHTEMEENELAAKLQQAVDQLNGKQKMIFVLRDMEGLEVPEVCQLVSLNEDQVKSNLYYARKKVQEWMKKNYY
jgi:RNA polymerase sigma-70 factor (ECF subfamily)